MMVRAVALLMTVSCVMAALCFATPTSTPHFQGSTTLPLRGEDLGVTATQEVTVSMPDGKPPAIGKTESVSPTLADGLGITTTETVSSTISGKDAHVKAPKSVSPTLSDDNLGITVTDYISSTMSDEDDAHVKAPMSVSPTLRDDSLQVTETHNISSTISDEEQGRTGRAGAWGTDPQGCPTWSTAVLMCVGTLLLGILLGFLIGRCSFVVRRHSTSNMDETLLEPLNLSSAGGDDDRVEGSEYSSCVVRVDKDVTTCEASTEKEGDDGGPVKEHHLHVSHPTRTQSKPVDLVEGGQPSNNVHDARVLPRFLHLHSLMKVDEVKKIVRFSDLEQALEKHFERRRFPHDGFRPAIYCPCMPGFLLHNGTPYLQDAEDALSRLQYHAVCSCGRTPSLLLIPSTPAPVCYPPPCTL